MLIPLGTDRALKRKPVITQALIGLNVLIYVLILAAFRYGGSDLEEIIGWGAFDTRRPERVWTLFTSMFLHDPGGISHILFNMIFLWAFGCAVEDRLGRLGFLGFYLAGGVAAALMQWLLASLQGDPSQMIGASGAVCAVTGGFAALFPRAKIRVFILFFFIGVSWIPALVVVGLFFALDFIGQLTNFLGLRTGNTAFAAHLGGSVFGFSIAFLLLATKLLKRDDFDIFFLFKQSRRRAAMRAATAESVGGPWASASADTPDRLQKMRSKKPPAPTEPPIVREARNDIRTLLVDHQPKEAARRYASMLKDHPEFMLSADHQLDVASTLFADGAFDEAAIAYELFLGKHPHDRRVIETAMLLAVLYVRKKPSPEKARIILDRYDERFRTQGHAALAVSLREEILE